MSLFHGPATLMNGLIFYVDAANKKSYPGTGTTWFDLTKNGNNGTLINGATFSSSNGGCIVLDGVNDYVSFGTTGIAPSSATIEVWFSTPTNYSSQSGYIIAIDNLDNPELRFAINAMKCRFDLFDDGAYIVTGSGTAPSFSTNVWTHMVATLTNGSQVGYQNGQQIVTGTGSYTGSSNTNVGEFSVGTYNRPSTGYGGYFNGNISLIRIYNRVLSASEILQNFNATRGRYGI
jgi:hypothetical protein